MHEIWRLDNRYHRWEKIIAVKYGVRRNSWDILAPNCGEVICLSRRFMSHVRFQARKGDHILFWLDTWVGDRPLTTQFLVPFGVLAIIMLMLAIA